MDWKTNSKSKGVKQSPNTVGTSTHRLNRWFNMHVFVLRIQRLTYPLFSIFPALGVLLILQIGKHQFCKDTQLWLFFTLMWSKFQNKHDCTLDLIADILLPSATSSKLVCHMTNWAQYRPGTAKFTPDNIDPFLCTHVIYALATINSFNQISPVEWNDEQQYGRLNSIKKVWVHTGSHFGRIQLMYTMFRFRCFI